MLGLTLPTILSLGLTLVIAITVHEFAHAYTADALGDPTPRMQGRVTLNPLKHLDPFGSILFILTGFGWGRPVMTNPANFARRGYGVQTPDNLFINFLESSSNPVRVGMAIVAAAGPFSNLLLALLAAIPVRLGLIQALNFGGIEGVTPSIADFIIIFISVNIGLMLFNLIPISPLDGSKIAVGLLPPALADPLIQIDRYGPLILMLLLISGFFGLFMRPAQNGLFNLITGL